MQFFNLRKFYMLNTLEIESENILKFCVPQKYSVVITHNFRGQV